MRNSCHSTFAKAKEDILHLNNLISSLIMKYLVYKSLKVE